MILIYVIITSVYIAIQTAGKSNDDSNFLYVFNISLQSNVPMMVTSIKQSPVFKGHLSCPVIKEFISTEPLLRGHLYYKATFSL